MNLNELLMERLNILEENHVICTEAANYSKIAVMRILAEIPDLEESKAVMFITHLAMAVQRILSGEDETALDSQVLKSVMDEPVFKQAQELRDELLQETEIQFPQSEKDFLAVHLCNLLT
ncbi:PRD domain-containing protein [Lacrimispora sp.]|uniref:PRD domain-containing protein n=1 Tax=Lacrimispora sp. TaxID=2719234 RepID=UPI0032E4FD2E|nr:PRD domain-containing protein [Paenibacillaceae bacterium]